MVAITVALLAIFANVAASAAVFAHFMVSKSVGYTVADWENEIRLAKEAHIDGFALNIAHAEATNIESLPHAFTAAANLGGFRHIFSFDYVGNGSWPKADVVSLIKTYGPRATYFKHEGTSKPLVSTFEGWEFPPSGPLSKPRQIVSLCHRSLHSGLKKRLRLVWLTVSSIGQTPLTSSGIGWPTGPNNMRLDTDISYWDLLRGKPYMMPVSPWFFANMPDFRANWLWRGDSLWFDRWTHVHYLKPQYVQIISWNDFGESHYIGPLSSRDSAYVVFSTSMGDSPFNYALGMPHDGWRLFLPWVIDRYKTCTSSITREGLSVWYRPHPAAACTSGGTTGNTANHLQTTYAPGTIAEDKIFFSALLASTATVTVSIGGVFKTAGWAIVPDGEVGLYHGSVSFNGATGSVVVAITRSGSTIAQVNGKSITTTCTKGVQNWNAWVGGQSAANSIAPVKPLGKHACPAAGRDITFEGLCSFCADNGYLLSSACVEQPLGTVCNAPLPVAPAVPACVAGTGARKYVLLCQFTCRYNFCPPEVCSCTLIAASAPAAPQKVGKASYRDTTGDEDFGLCGWACNRGFCDREACNYLEFGQILKEIGDDVDINPIFAAMKLTAMEEQNSIYMITYWSACSARPECGVGYTTVTTGHGKVYNAERGTYVLNGCHGGGNGFNRALCVKSDVVLQDCNWFGKPKNCGQSCPPGYFLLAQNTHIGGAKTGCKANYFSSYCCSQIHPNNINYCPVSTWERSFVGSVGGARAQNAVTEQSDDIFEVIGTEKECDGHTNGRVELGLSIKIALGTFAGFPVYWFQYRSGEPRWVPLLNRAITQSAAFTTTTTVYEHTSSLTVSSPITTGTCDDALYPQACGPL